jgi:hypothetical protein
MGPHETTRKVRTPQERNASKSKERRSQTDAC